MNNDQPGEALQAIAENMKATGGAADALTELFEQLGPDVKANPNARTARRANARAQQRNAIAVSKDRISRQTANARGTLPDARELFRIEKTRQALNANPAIKAALERNAAGTATHIDEEHTA